MTHYRINESGNAVTPLLGVIVAIALIALAAYGTYLWQQRTINQQKATITSLNEQLKNPTPGQGMPTTTTTRQSTNTTYTSSKGTKVTVYAPLTNAKVSSPVAVIGEVPGNWSSEAQFPIELKDSKGNMVAQATAHVLGNWMTSSLVPFSASLTYTGTPSGSGTLVLHKDNPSGQAQNDDQASVTISF